MGCGVLHQQRTKPDVKKRFPTHNPESSSSPVRGLLVQSGGARVPSQQSISSRTVLGNWAAFSGLCGLGF